MEQRQSKHPLLSPAYICSDCQLDKPMGLWEANNHPPQSQSETWQLPQGHSARHLESHSHPLHRSP